MTDYVTAALEMISPVCRFCSGRSIRGASKPRAACIKSRAPRKEKANREGKSGRALRLGPNHRLTLVGLRHWEMVSDEAEVETDRPQPLDLLGVSRPAL